MSVMSVTIRLGNTMPTSCDECKLFVKHMGYPAYCSAGAEYTEKEIESATDGMLNMYYHGCLASRPKNCPLEELKEGDKDGEHQG